MQIQNISATKQEKPVIRVAAYARVSSDKDAAFHSLSNQREYYEAYVAVHEGWELVGLYSDDGISGTTENRPEFQRLLTDCRAGKVDLVVTKSITRFARNTVILLETIRELKGLGIDCYFEKENMHSISPDGELFLTLLAMYAEEEARSASENQKWRIKERFEQGLPWVGNMLGYRLVDGKMVIMPEEAELVRQIYDLYLSGKGLSAIAKTLCAEYDNLRDATHFTPCLIRKILRNEKYVGDMLLQKTYSDDFRTKRRRINHGELRAYYIRESHTGIIERDVYDRVQKEMARRKELYAKGRTNTNAKKHLFAGLIQCGYCGHFYRYTNDKNYGKSLWICPTYYYIGKAACPSQRILESVLIEKTREVLGLGENDELTRELLEKRIAMIIIPEKHHLLYELTDDTEVSVAWEHPSRSKSWTEAMRQAAREKSMARVKRGDKNE